MRKVLINCVLGLGFYEIYWGILKLSLEVNRLMLNLFYRFCIVLKIFWDKDYLVDFLSILDFLLVWMFLDSGIWVVLR